MIRVLHVFGTMNRGGAETMIMNVYRNIDRTNIQFDFLCLNEQKGDYDDEIKTLGGNIYYADAPSKVGYIKHIKEIIKICKNKGPYKVIHIPTMFHSGIVCLAAYIANVPIRIVHSHSASESQKGIKRNLYNFICRRLINWFSTNKIACGIEARNFLFGKSRKVQRDVKIINNGINLKEYYNISTEEKKKMKMKFNVKDDDFVIGHVGSFKKIKNQIFFINIAKELVKKQNNFKIFLVGDGEDRNKIQNKIEEEKLNDYFILPGIREDIPKIMSIFNIFVMPSLYEGFPMVIIEALATLKNCVVSNNISQEVNIDNKSVAFLNLNDPIENWLDVIFKQSKKNINKEERIKILSEKGFDIKSTVNELEKIYIR